MPLKVPPRSFRPNHIFMLRAPESETVIDVAKKIADERNIFFITLGEPNEVRKKYKFKGWHVLCFVSGTTKSEEWYEDYGNYFLRTADEIKLLEEIESHINGENDSLILFSGLDAFVRWIGPKHMKQIFKHINQSLQYSKNGHMLLYQINPQKCDAKQLAIFEKAVDSIF